MASTNTTKQAKPKKKTTKKDAAQHYADAMGIAVTDERVKKYMRSRPEWKDIDASIAKYAESQGLSRSDERVKKYAARIRETVGASA